MECIFCSIAAKKLPATMVFEDEALIAFQDIHPKAAVHLLIVPKVHRSSLAETTLEDTELLGQMLTRARELAEKQGIAERGYKVVINTGKDGGQIIPHLHLHLLGGEPIHGAV